MCVWGLVSVPLSLTQLLVIGLGSAHQCFEIPVVVVEKGVPWGELRTGDHSHFPFLRAQLVHSALMAFFFFFCSAVPSPWPAPVDIDNTKDFPWPGPCPSLPSPAKPHVFACSFHSYSWTPKLPKLHSPSASSLLPGQQRSRRLRVASPSPPCLGFWENPPCPVSCEGSAIQEGVEVVGRVSEVVAPSPWVF